MQYTVFTEMKYDGSCHIRFLYCKYLQFSADKMAKFCLFSVGSWCRLSLNSWKNIPLTMAACFTDASMAWMSLRGVANDKIKYGGQLPSSIFKLLIMLYKVDELRFCLDSFFIKFFSDSHLFEKFTWNVSRAEIFFNLYSCYEIEWSWA